MDARGATLRYGTMAHALGEGSTMRKVDCTITHPDCSETALGLIGVDQMIEFFRTHDWESEAQRLADRSETDADSCYPGLAITLDDGRDLNVLPESDDEFFVSYRYPKRGAGPLVAGAKDTRRVAQLLLPRKDFPEFVYHLYQGDHLWILEKSLRPRAVVAGTVALWASLLGWIAGGTWLLIRAAGINPNSDMSLRDLVLFLSWIGLMIFLACVVWLGIARLLLTREEAMHVWWFKDGKWKVDRWLFELFFRARSRPDSFRPGH